jgi:hypothetical protein
MARSRLSAAARLAAAKLSPEAKATSGVSSAERRSPGLA